MGQSTTRKRPWLAALLATLATGLGHLYLRRWWRAFGWLAVAFGVAAFFVDPAALEALATWDAVDPLAVAPILIVGSLNVVDAYLLARVHNESARRPADADEALTHCPRCGNELDPELEFCHWCTTEVEEFEDGVRENGVERDAS